MKESKRVGLLVAIAAIVLGSPAVANAARSADFERASVRVSYADLDLSSDAGVARLYRRLKGASESICGPQTMSTDRSLVRLKHSKKCYRDVLSKAVAKVDNAKLSALHAS